MKNVTCKRCGWVHMEVSLEYINKWEADWKVYWTTLDTEGKKSFGVLAGPPTKESEYMKCNACRGSYKNFRDSQPGDCPDGCTISGILNREE